MTLVNVTYAAITMQQQHDVRLNPFAAQLLTESFEGQSEEVQAGGIGIIGYGKKQNIYIILTRDVPTVSPVQAAADQLLSALRELRRAAKEFADDHNACSGDLYARLVDAQEAIQAATGVEQPKT